MSPLRRLVLLTGLCALAVSIVAMTASPAKSSTSAYIEFCHSSDEALAWCEWVEFMEDPHNAAWFEWATRPQVPPLLRAIRWCEAGAYIGLPYGETDYTAVNQAGSSASGGYQILDSTWRAWRTYVPGAEQYARALHAPPEVQDDVAIEAFRRHGSSPWNASRGCWG